MSASEAVIRAAVLCRVALPGVLVREELGLIGHSVRADVATLGEHFHLYEIKGPDDSLRRLPFQAEVYSQVADRCTLVLSPTHLKKAAEIVPQWWGVVLAYRAEGGVRLEDWRFAADNPSPSPGRIARLLWSTEAAKALRATGGMPNLSRARLHERCSELANRLSLAELRTVVHGALRARSFGRGGFAA